MKTSLLGANEVFGRSVWICCLHCSKSSFFVGFPFSLGTFLLDHQLHQLHPFAIFLSHLQPHSSLSTCDLVIFLWIPGDVGSPRCSIMCKTLGRAAVCLDGHPWRTGCTCITNISDSVLPFHVYGGDASTLKPPWVLWSFITPRMSLNIGSIVPQSMTIHRGLWSLLSLLS